jgi:hypothetical protein
MEVGTGDGAIPQSKQLSTEGLEAHIILQVPHTDVLKVGIGKRQKAGHHGCRWNLRSCGCPCKQARLGQSENSYQSVSKMACPQTNPLCIQPGT